MNSKCPKCFATLDTGFRCPNECGTFPSEKIETSGSTKPVREVFGWDNIDILI